MDKVFKAIGRFFKKIWEWIISTYWVAPILLVGIVFGLVFSINPIVNAIQKAVNADDTGKFYEAHEVCYRDLFKAGTLEGQKANYSSKYLLNEDSGDVLVIYVSDTSIEADVATFMKSDDGKNCKLYIVNFAEDDNKKSEYSTSNKEYVDNAGAYFYDHLLTSLEEAYNSLDEGSWRTTYAKDFKDQYGYSIFYSGFGEDDTYKITSTDAKNASNDIKLPTAVKYHNGKIVDMRFASSNSFTSYSGTNKQLTNVDVLTDLWKGVTPKEA